MKKQIQMSLKGHKIEKILILLFCMVITVCSILVMTRVYEPNYNALGALASVSMDVICMLIILVLVLNLTFDKTQMNQTTRMFLLLMVGTLFALFFDFLNWAYDGSLAYGNWTYVYTVTSLCSGSILAGAFVLYLCSYLDDMYDARPSSLSIKICLMSNLVAFVITMTLGLTKTAFAFVDGHYEIGALYDVITVIPILSLIYLTVFALRRIRIIGVHDFFAVAGYISIMIAGVLTEAAIGVGTSYVSVTIADIFIFVMLQNKYIDRARKQREVLAQRITSQYEILDSMAGIYLYVNYVDLSQKTVRRFDMDESHNENVDLKNDPHSQLNKTLFEGMEDKLKDKFWAYTDLSTLQKRMGNEKIISAEFCHKKDGWFRAQYIRIGDSSDGPVEKVIYAIRNIDEEKKNVEKWIRQSNTDELTGFYNRHAYEDEISALEGGTVKDDFVYVSIDVNSLKIVNDTLGHEAGDEILIGACECMRQCFGAYGKLFRTGGDEFAALIFADDGELEEIKNDLEEVTENWRGKLNKHLAISCGFVTRAENANQSIREMAVLADKRMYDEKANYYRKRGIDRRGQRDAHVALCALYTKILKVNVTEDTYQIVNMNSDEQTKDKGFADSISAWLYDFGVSGQVHPDDLEAYLSKTNLEYIRTYFKSRKESLHIFYRRKYNDEYKKVMMEMIPANDYSDDNQNLFLYVKDIEE